MNGRIEHAPALELELAIYSEPNYSNIDFFFSEARTRKWKRRATDALILGALWGALWLITWGAARAL
jgi:hypothetical protein